MSLFNFLSFLAIVLSCFFVPSFFRWRKDVNWLSAKRFFAGAIAVGFLLACLQFSFWGAIGPKWAFLREVAFLWLGTAIYWGPLLIIRIAQLVMRERRQYASV
ncbi:hypothetical protein CSC82_08575 [Rhodobacteraceae bacterium 4F10]|nr:hypothetical protein CSC82_08575 [Rhodobacteraceae bacterium 4F10]